MLKNNYVYINDDHDHTIVGEVRMDCLIQRMNELGEVGYYLTMVNWERREAIMCKSSRQEKESE